MIIPDSSTYFLEHAAEGKGFSLKALGVRWELRPGRTLFALWSDRGELRQIAPEKKFGVPKDCVRESCLPAEAA